MSPARRVLMILKNLDRAKNQQVVLDGYTVSNTYRALENFYYPFLIEVENDFVVPNGGNAKISSKTEIVLKPGFEAESGSSFIAAIKVDDPLKMNAKENQLVRERGSIPFRDIPNYDMDFYLTQEEIVLEELSLPISVYPNPFEERIVVESPQRSGSGRIEIYDMLGNLRKAQSFTGLEYQQVDQLNGLSNGVYLLRVVYEDREILNIKLVKQ